MTDTADKELVVTRVFDAPRELLYRAFIDPDQLAQWFGPVGFSVPRDTVDIDARVGGHQRFVMVSDTDPATRSPVNVRFTEIVENEPLVGTEDWKSVPGQQGTASMQLRLEFHDDDGKTRLVLRRVPTPPSGSRWPARVGELVHQVGRPSRTLRPGRTRAAARRRGARITPCRVSAGCPRPGARRRPRRRRSR